MDTVIMYWVVVLFVIRLLFLRVSKMNEKRIVANGGVEYGKGVSKAMAIVHCLIYLCALMESLWTHTKIDSVSIVGMLLTVFSMIILYWITRLLRDIWTVKLMVAKDHTYNNHWLFRYIKHPNYFLNIIPELIGICLLCHAWYTLMVAIPVYGWIMYQRIREENQILRNIIAPNSL